MSRVLNLLIIAALVSLSVGFSFTTVYADGQNIILSKLASTDNATLGDNITYTYTIINNSTDNITNLKLIDDKIGPIALPDDLELAAGDNVTATSSYIVSISDYSDSATGTGKCCQGHWRLIQQ